MPEILMSGRPCLIFLFTYINHLCIVIVPLKYDLPINNASLYHHFTPHFPLSSLVSPNSLAASHKSMLGPLVYFLFWSNVLFLGDACIPGTQQTMLLKFPEVTMRQVARPSTSGTFCRSGVWYSQLLYFGDTDDVRDCPFLSRPVCSLGPVPHLC